ncbi:MAG: NAD(P)-dependent oxidoreductase [Bacteroidales bacterium]|jgi:nucleoside-diphosphate-sugar epimerase|nr:NAD(P)-dependent oxidoreductase [Bacteroidales bacterium]
MKKIVVTGSNGFIGQSLVTVLKKTGHEVWCLDIAADSNDRRSIQVDFLNAENTRTAFERIGNFNTLIHLAAVAHHQKIDSTYDECTVNVEITKNILNACDFIEHLIFFSSVAVYGEENQTCPVQPSVPLHPATLYGEGKKQCEKIILESNHIHKTDILRPAPIYDTTHKTDIAKRVYFPKLKLKMAMYPSPSYSFCNIDTVIDNVLNLIATPPTGRRVRNLADSLPFRQRDLCREFSGISIPVFVPFLFPFYFTLKLLPCSKSYSLRSLFRKLFTNCIYSSDIIEI